MFFSYDKNFLDLPSEQGSNMQYNIADYSHHAVCEIPGTYLSYNWESVCFDPLHIFIMQIFKHTEKYKELHNNHQAPRSGFSKC